MLQKKNLTTARVSENEGCRRTTIEDKITKHSYRHNKKKQQLGNNTRTHKFYPHLNNDLFVFKPNIRVIITSSPTE